MSVFVSGSKGEAAAIETELLRDYRFGQQQLIEIWGQACALAITKVSVSPIFQINCVVLFLFLYTTNSQFSHFSACIADLLLTCLAHHSTIIACAWARRTGNSKLTVDKVLCEHMVTYNLKCIHWLENCYVNYISVCMHYSHMSALHLWISGDSVSNWTWLTLQYPWTHNVVVTSFLQDNHDINYSGWKIHSGTHSVFLPVIMSFSNTKIFFVLPVAVLANALMHSQSQHTLKRKHRFERFETSHFSSFPPLSLLVAFTLLEV